MSGKETPDEEAIGRPAGWGEGRYQPPGQPLSEGVAPPDEGNGAAPEIESTPVTHEDYESLEPPRHGADPHE